MKNTFPLLLAQMNSSIERANQDNYMDVFFKCQHFNEAYAKWFFICAVPLAKIVEIDKASRIEFNITRKTTYGSWVDGISNLNKIVSNNKDDFPKYLFTWLNKKMDESVSWHVVALNTLKTINFEAKSNIDLLKFLVELRNKISHGTPGQEFYYKSNKHVLGIVKYLLETPINKVKVYTKVLGAISKYRLLEGINPKEIIDLTKYILINNSMQSDVNSYSIYDTNAGKGYALPPFFIYKNDSNDLYLLNRPINKNRKARFHNYIRDEDFDSDLFGYDHEPPIIEVGKVGKIPKIEVSKQQDAGVFGEIAIRPGLISSYEWPKLEWYVIPFKDNQKIVLPSNKNKGVYMFVAEVCSFGIACHQIIGYVGKADDLKNRFTDYIRERNNSETSRDLVHEFLNKFEKIHFHFTCLENEQDRINVEDALIKILDPPANIRQKMPKFKTGRDKPIWTKGEQNGINPSD